MSEGGARPSGGAWRIPDAVLWGGALLALLFTWRYLDYPDLPGNRAEFREGWLAWWDQSKSFESAHALAHGDLASGRHWYPLGYALLGAPFAREGHAHPFFFVDLASLLLTFGAFVAFSRRLGVGAPVATLLFLLSVAADTKLFGEWIIPWNTTPTSALIWLLLANVAAYLDGQRRPFLIGLLAGAVPTMRPTELAVVAPCLLAVVLATIPQRRRRVADLGWMALGGAAPLAGYAALYLRIYGPHPTDYMVQSGELGFSLHALAWKAYVILVDPRVWFAGGEGFLHRAPWLALGFAGLIPALARGGARATLAAALIVHAVIYLSYVDLLPSGFWRYHLLHYWVWTLPAYALLGLLLLRDLARPEPAWRRPLAGAAVVFTLALLCLHLVPVAAEGREAFAADFAGPMPAFEDAYFRPWKIRDALGEQANVTGVRGQAIPEGLRVLSLRRPLEGEIRFIPDEGFPGSAFPTEAVRRWNIGVRLGRPCWIAPMRCHVPGSDAMFMAR